MAAVKAGRNVNGVNVAIRLLWRIIMSACKTAHNPRAAARKSKLYERCKLSNRSSRARARRKPRGTRTRPLIKPGKNATDEKVHHEQDVADKLDVGD